MAWSPCLEPRAAPSKASQTAPSWGFRLFLIIIIYFFFFFWGGGVRALKFFVVFSGVLGFELCGFRGLGL